MATITGDMVINEVIKKFPATIKVFNDYRVDSCCGGGAPIEVTARRDGVDVDALVRALNAAAEGSQAGARSRGRNVRNPPIWKYPLDTSYLRSAKISA